MISHFILLLLFAALGSSFAPWALPIHVLTVFSSLAAAYWFRLQYEHQIEQAGWCIQFANLEEKNGDQALAVGARKMARDETESAELSHFAYYTQMVAGFPIFAFFFGLILLLYYSRKVWRRVKPRLIQTGSAIYQQTLGPALQRDESLRRTKKMVRKELMHHGLIEPEKSSQSSAPMTTEQDLFIPDTREGSVK